MDFENLIPRLLRCLPEFEMEYKRLVGDGWFDTCALRRDLEESRRELGIKPIEDSPADIAELPTYRVVGELLSFVVNRIADLDHDFLDRLARFLEDAAASEDVRVTNVVQVQFLEGVWQMGDHRLLLECRLGPMTRCLLDRAESW